MINKIKIEPHLSALDRLGFILSLVCVVHCFAIPFLAISMPILARYYLMHPYAHIILAVAILPVGGVAFWHGFKHHQKKITLIVGLSGLLIVGVLPLVMHILSFVSLEPYVVSLGSLLLIYAHWNNQTRCSGTCSKH